MIRKYSKSLVLGFLPLLRLLLLLGPWDATFSDDDVLEDVVQLLVLADGCEDVVGYEALGGLVLLPGVGFLEDFFYNLLEDGCEVDWGVRRDAIGIAAFFEMPVDAAHWENDACAC